MEYNQQTSYLTFDVKQSIKEEKRRPNYDTDQDILRPCIVIDYECLTTTSFDLQPFNRRQPLVTLEPDRKSLLKVSEHVDLSTPKSRDELFAIITCNLLELEIGPQHRDGIAYEIIRVGEVALSSESDTEIIYLDVHINADNGIVCDERSLVLQRSMAESCHMVPATKASVDGLKSKKLEFSEEDSEHGGNIPNCVVCMEEFTPGIEVACMPCAHLFHHECITSWLETGHHCPVCRFEMPTENEEDEVQDEDEDDDQDEDEDDDQV